MGGGGVYVFWALYWSIVTYNMVTEKALKKKNISVNRVILTTVVMWKDSWSALSLSNKVMGLKM